MYIFSKIERIKNKIDIYKADLELTRIHSQHGVHT